MIGKPAPLFTLVDLNGKTHSLQDYIGKIIWLEFWVTWCAACQDTLPKKDVFYRSLKHPGLAFLTIHVTDRDPDEERLASFAKEAGYQFPILRDKGRKTYDSYGLDSVPSTVIINSNGIIHAIYNETVPFTHVIKEIGYLLSSP